MKVYVANIAMSSPNHQDATTTIDEYTKQTTLTFDEDTRNAIAAARMRTKKPLYENSLDFYGIYIVREDQLPRLKEAAGKGAADLSRIRQEFIDKLQAEWEAAGSPEDKPPKEVPILTAKLVTASLDMDDMAKGDTYQSVLNLIRYNIYTTVFQRLTKIISSKKGMTDTSRNALLRMIENLRVINVLNDANIEAQLNGMKAQIEASLLTELKTDMEKGLAALDTRGGQILV